MPHPSHPDLGFKENNYTRLIRIIITVKREGKKEISDVYRSKSYVQGTTTCNNTQMIIIVLGTRAQLPNLRPPQRQRK